jgi:DNA-binding MarR family transcriptional regulator
MASQDAFELSIFRSLRRIMRAVDIHSRKLSTEFQITGPQLLCLQTLHEVGPLTTSDLARHIHLSSSTLVGITDRMEEKGWLRRQRSTSDRRVVTIDITARGEAFLEKAPGLLQDRLAQSLRNLPETEQRAMVRSLDKIVSLLELAPREGAPLHEVGRLVPPKSLKRKKD